MAIYSTIVGLSRGGCAILTQSATAGKILLLKINCQVKVIVIVQTPKSRQLIQLVNKSYRQYKQLLLIVHVYREKTTVTPALYYC